ncbi:MAG TPA: threonine-phosphate decarboxylase, partial [Candidatus Methanoperedenaceae archaeon]|nr:threonine-phosphate decarboxylase [Candidatus Methanoperedenaceae archaeon]
MDFAPCVHGGRVDESAELAGKGRSSMLDFSVNLNPLPMPGLGRVLASTVKQVGEYPDNRYIEFREAAARFAGVSTENIIPVSGSSELIRLFAESVIERGDRVIIPQPTFDEYECQSRLFGASVEFVPYADAACIDPSGAKLLFLCNPNNPTGTLIARDELVELAVRCGEAGTFLFIDEAFIELSYAGESMAVLAALNDHVLVSRSLTKAFAVPGLRAGFGVASSRLSGILNRSRLTWNLSAPASAAGAWMMKNGSAYLQKSREFIKKEREWLSGRLSLIRGLVPLPGDACFICVEVGGFCMDSTELAERMLKNGIIIRDCSSFHSLGRRYIRIAVRKRRDNLRLITAFASIVSQWGQELAHEKIDEALRTGYVGSRENCEYYPCHFRGQDCTFCF